MRFLMNWLRGNARPSAPKTAASFEPGPIRKKPRNLPPELSFHPRGKSDHGDDLCDRYTLTGDINFKIWINVRELLARKHPTAVIMSTLDDLPQAEYTNMHTTLKHDLDVQAEDGDTPEAGDAFADRLARFAAKTEGTAPIQFEGIFADQGRGLDASVFDANRDPSLVLDSEVYFWVVPVKQSHLAVAAFPNGYFSSDLNPFEISHLAHYLEHKFGFALCGIGAEYVAFSRSDPLPSSNLEEAANAFSKLFLPEVEAEAGAFFRSHLTTNTTVLLCYVDTYIKRRD